MSDLSQPTTHAFVFVIEDNQGVMYDAYLDLKQVADFFDWQVRYRRQDQPAAPWTYLSPALHPDGQGAFQSYLADVGQVNAKFSTEATCRAELLRVCEGYSAVIRATFGEPQSAGGSVETPTTYGLDYLLYLLRTQVREDNNVLTLA